MTRLLLILPLLLSACGGGGARPESAAPRQQAVEIDDGLPLKRLSEQSLPANGCALFLWSVGGQRKLVLASRSDTQTARVALASGEVELARQSFQGVGLGGFPQQARFVNGPVAVSWSLVFEQRPDVTEGAVVPSGTLVFTPAGGDEVAMPVAGIVGCRAG